MEGAIPQFTKYVGEDVDLNAIFRNIGAPKFINYGEKAMSVRFSMEVDLFDENYDQLFATLQFFDVVIEMDMWLEGLTLNFNWKEINMESAQVSTSRIPAEVLEEYDADQHVENYFNWSFDLILPWMQNSRVKNVNSFELPKKIPGII